VRTGAEIAGARNPIQLPAKERGTEMRNQIPTITSIVVKGTAPDDALAQRNRFSKKNVLKTIPGTNRGVSAMFSFHLSPLKAL